jgi:predicted nuclease of predicted toxin-antitoxin system
MAFWGCYVLKCKVLLRDSTFLDFIELIYRFGSPPQILWVTCGNVTNRNLRQIFQKTFPQALTLLEQGEVIVEISDKS